MTDAVLNVEKEILESGGLSIEGYVSIELMKITKGYPGGFSKLLIKALVRFMKIRKYDQFINRYREKTGIDLIEAAFDYLNFSYIVSNTDLKKIPAKGPLVTIANHPLGGLDGISLVHMVSRVRKDVYVVVNDLLMKISNFNGLFLPLNVFSGRLQVKSIKRIARTIQEGHAVIFFPAGEVSRLTIKGIRDSAWSQGAFYMAQRYQAPILPVYIAGRNSFIFYLISKLNKKFSFLLLPREIFYQHSRKIGIQVGELINNTSTDENIEIDDHYVNKIRQKVENLKNKN